MEAIGIEFVTNPKKDDQAAGDAKSKPKNIDERKMPCSLTGCGT